jgi:MATE family multidrug resistance protein
MRGWKRELRELLTLGVPMGLTQLVQFSIHTIDVVMVGRLGPEPLAGASLGLVILYVVFLFGFGPAMSVSPMVSHALGANPEAFDDARRSVRMALWTIFVGTALLSATFCFTTEIALALGQPAIPAALAEPYVLAMAPGLSFMVATMALRNFLAVIGHTRAPLLFIVLSTALNAFLNWLLIYGNWGFPRLELVGAGIASSLSNFIGFGLMLLYIRLEPSSRRFELFRNFFRASWSRLREVAALSWPISVTSTFEAMLFNAAVFLMGRIGVEEMAAYQVALNVAALAFMTPLGLSMAGAVRVGLMKGRGDMQGVRTAAGVSILACIGAIMLVAVPVMLNPRGIGGLYLDAADPASAGLLDMVASFLPIAAAFALFDATQVAANQALRGLKDVRVPMLMTAIAYWVIGFPLAAWLGLRSPLGAIGVWWGLLVALAVAALLLGLRLFALTRGEGETELAPAT